MRRTSRFISTWLIPGVDFARRSACVLLRLPLTCNRLTRNMGLPCRHMGLPSRTSVGFLVAILSRLPSGFLSQRLLANVRANVSVIIVPDLRYLLRRAFAKRDRFVPQSICGSSLTGAASPVVSLSVVRGSVMLARISLAYHEFVTIFACMPTIAV